MAGTNPSSKCNRYRDNFDRSKLPFLHLSGSRRSFPPVHARQRLHYCSHRLWSGVPVHSKISHCDRRTLPGKLQFLLRNQCHTLSKKHQQRVDQPSVILCEGRVRRSVRSHNMVGSHDRTRLTLPCRDPGRSQLSQLHPSRSSFLVHPRAKLHNNARDKPKQPVQPFSYPLDVFWARNRPFQAVFTILEGLSPLQGEADAEDTAKLHAHTNPIHTPISKKHRKTAPDKEIGQCQKKSR